MTTTKKTTKKAAPKKAAKKTNNKKKQTKSIKKPTKVLFIDLDGTLVQEHNTDGVPLGALSALKELADKGVELVIATGRSHLLSAKVEEQLLRITGSGRYAIEFNGAQIYDVKNNKIISKEVLPEEAVRAAIDMAAVQK